MFGYRIGLFSELEQCGKKIKERSKSIHRRLGDPCFLRNYFVGKGIDICVSQILLE